MQAVEGDPVVKVASSSDEGSNVVGPPFLRTRAQAWSSLRDVWPTFYNVCIKIIQLAGVSCILWRTLYFYLDILIVSLRHDLFFEHVQVSILTFERLCHGAVCQTG